MKKERDEFEGEMFISILEEDMYVIDEFLVDSWGLIGCVSGLVGYVLDWMYIIELWDGLIRRFWGYLGVLIWSFYLYLV